MASGVARDSPVWAVLFVGATLCFANVLACIFILEQNRRSTTENDSTSITTAHAPLAPAMTLAAVSIMNDVRMPKAVVNAKKAVAFPFTFFNSNLRPSSSRPVDSSREHKKPIRSTAFLSLGLGPKGTSRQYYRYYDSLYYAALQFGAEAKSGIEVGCAADPFLKHLDWIDKRVCVAPYFAKYGKAGNSDGTAMHGNEKEIINVQADFMEYSPPHNGTFDYDLLICSQVLEHVPDPASFMKKLISTAKVSIISVPYDWGPCEKCGHITNHITYEMLLEWSEPYLPIFSSVVIEKHLEQRVVDRMGRMILVFTNTAA